MPELIVRYEPNESAATITASEDLPGPVWNRVTQACNQIDPDGRIVGRSITIGWAEALAALIEIAALRTQLAFGIRAEGEAEERLRQFRAERAAVQAARNNQGNFIDYREIEQRLRDCGFVRRTLRTFQLHDVQRMLAVNNGANFSVPGAGKTTVALAVNLLAFPVPTRMLVVAPKNAFEAWDSVIADCIDPAAPNRGAEPFTRLDGSLEEFQHLLESQRRRFLISYDRFIRTRDLVAAYLRRFPTHVVLDESHRIKAGEFSQRGRALLSVASLPIRKDILSGTPAPHAIDDLVPQLDFLWPGMGLGRQVVTTDSPRTVLTNLYVRTTKQDLGLPPATRRFVHVPMTEAQLGLYGILRSEAIRQITGLRSNSQIDIIRARRSVMRLLQVSVDPVAAAIAIGGDAPAGDGRTEALMRAVLDSGDSPKFLEACRIARNLASQNKKVVIWSIFRRSIDRLAMLLSDLKPMVLHGDVPTGSNQDIATREGRIKSFHDDPNCFVVIANPAACSEGISLHTVCHEAVYLDRSYNAAHYLQSLDRIHRLGLAPDTETHVTILQSVAPERLGSIDHSVSRRLLTKMRLMENILNDEDIRQLALDEEESEPPVDRDVTLDDLTDLLAQLTTGAIPDEQEQA